MLSQRSLFSADDPALPGLEFQIVCPSIKRLCVFVAQRAHVITCSCSVLGVCVPGDRAEGAEVTLGLNKLTLTVAQKQEDSEDEEDPHFINPEISSPSAATAILLFNSV